MLSVGYFKYQHGPVPMNSVRREVAVLALPRAAILAMCCLAQVDARGLLRSSISASSYFSVDTSIF